MAQFRNFQLSGTSPASPGTAVLATINGLDQFTLCNVHALLIGATGGTLDVYLQCSNNWRAGSKDETGDFSSQTARWYDVAHFPQLLASASAIRYLVNLSRGYAVTAAITAVNAADGTPSMAANTVLTGYLGGALRVVCVAGASTSAGAALEFDCIASEG